MYSIKFQPSAARDYKRLPQNEIKKINKAVDGLALNPRPEGYTKLKNRNGFRIRIGDYRILYEIDTKNQLVLIFRVRHRKEVYKNI